MVAKHRTQSPRTARRRMSRRAYILVAVLGFAALSAALGLAFLDSSSTVMPEAVNYRGLVRAQYLAGSGVQLAMHYLMYPPTTVNYGNYWTGANNVSLDGSSDVYSVSVLRSDQWSPPRNDPNLFRIISQAVATDPDSTPRAKRSVVAEVIAPPTGKWDFRHALLGYSSLATFSIANGTIINGNVHANASLLGYGWCQGIVSASATATWLGSGPPSSVQSLASSITAPSTNSAFYSTYTINGKAYTAYTGFTASEMKASDANALNAMDMSASNPGRIIMCKSGNFKIRGGAHLNGTLVVQGGRLEVDDTTASSVTAVPFFPALIVQGDIKFLNDDGAFTVNGSVISSGILDVNDQKRYAATFNGVTIFRSGVQSVGSSTQIRFNWQADRSIFWDFQGVTPPRPITVLSWKEN